VIFPCLRAPFGALRTLRVPHHNPRVGGSSPSSGIAQRAFMQPRTLELAAPCGQQPAGAGSVRRPTRKWKLAAGPMVPPGPMANSEDLFRRAEVGAADATVVGADHFEGGRQRLEEARIPIRAGGGVAVDQQQRGSPLRSRQAGARRHRSARPSQTPSGREPAIGSAPLPRASGSPDRR
jgi:hypothetical protein